MSKRNAGRLPVVGSLPAGEPTTLSVRPIEANHLPVVLSAHMGDIVIENYTETSVTLINKTQWSVPYVLVFAPRETLELAMLPWRRALGDLLDIGRKVGHFFVPRKLPHGE